GLMQLSASEDPSLARRANQKMLDLGSARPQHWQMEVLCYGSTAVSVGFISGRAPSKNRLKMAPANPRSANDPDTDRALLESAWKRIETHLEKVQHRIYDQIKTYPRPIPGCDVQFNTLLEERAGITQELARLHEGAGAGLECGDPRVVLDEFLRS